MIDVKTIYNNTGMWLMMVTGIILVQHGDFPFEFKENNQEMFMLLRRC